MNIEHKEVYQMVGALARRYNVSEASADSALVRHQAGSKSYNALYSSACRTLRKEKARFVPDFPLELLGSNDNSRTRDYLECVPDEIRQVVQDLMDGYNDTEVKARNHLTAWKYDHIRQSLREIYLQEGLV